MTRHLGIIVLRRLTLLSLVCLIPPAYAAWSSPENISQASQSASTVGVVTDSNEVLHLFFTAVPGTGVTQLFHTFRTTDGVWSTPVLLSTPGNPLSGVVIPGGLTNVGRDPSLPAAFAFAQENQTGVLHCFFEQDSGSGIAQVWHTALDTNDLVGGWSPPENISQASQPAFAVGIVLDSSNTLHVLFTAVPGTGEPQLFHIFRQSNGTWSTPVLLSTPGNPLGGVQIPGGQFDSSTGQDNPRLPAVYAFVLEDRAGILHCFFEQASGSEVVQVWHTELDTSDLVGGWSPPEDISQASQPASTVGIMIDSNSTLHVLLAAVPGTGAIQLFHTFRPQNGNWSNPILLSTPGNPLTGAAIPGGVTFFPNAAPELPAPYAFIQEDQSGILHCFFEQAPGSGIAQIWHMELDTEDLLGGWSLPEDISLAGQPASTVAILIDSINTIHVFFRSVPGSGAPQLFHTSRQLSGSWPTPVLLSTRGNPELSAVIPGGLAHLLDIGEEPYLPAPYSFVQVDRAGVLHCFFEQNPGIGFAQVWHTELDTHDLIGGWSPPENVSQANRLAVTVGTVIDSGNIIHLFFTAAPNNGEAQLFHTFRPPGGSWSTQILLSTPGNPLASVTIPGGLPALHSQKVDSDLPAPYLFAEEDQAGTLHCFFEQEPGTGVAQVWHTELHTKDLLSSVPPAVSDGSAGVPLEVLGASGSFVSISWDTSCNAADYQVIFSGGSRFPGTPGGTYGVLQGGCNLGTESPQFNIDVPDPSTDPTNLIWFLIVATGGSVEGSWGTDSFGNERNGFGPNGSSDVCGISDKILTNTCGN